mmetsp:Transcript_39284/g.63729  ORF Transcript_39284/g.63729 Transcript_39284/m.63729 type:complete len:142 (-) Transcript_39284:779-1204(-)
MQGSHAHRVQTEASCRVVPFQEGTFRRTRGMVVEVPPVQVPCVPLAHHIRPYENTALPLDHSLPDVEDTALSLVRPFACHRKEACPSAASVSAGKESVQGGQVAPAAAQASSPLVHPQVAQVASQVQALALPLEVDPDASP